MRTLLNFLLRQNRFPTRAQIIEPCNVLYKCVHNTNLTASHNTNLTASDQLLFVYTCLPNATLILFELLTTAPVNALSYIENFQGHKTENAFI